MQAAKEYYKTYVADDGLMTMNEKLLDLIREENPVHAFEFGMGSGKHIRKLRESGISAFGIDVSPMNVIKCISNHDGVGLMDETYLRHFCNADVVFTVSVLDHIKYVTEIINEFKRIANKSVFLLEAELHDPEKFYYYHDYAGYNFIEIGEFTSTPGTGDGNVYKIWKWEKGKDATEFIADDDLGMSYYDLEKKYS